MLLEGLVLGVTTKLWIVICNFTKTDWKLIKHFSSDLVISGGTFCQ